MFVVSQAHGNAGRQSRRDGLCLILWVIAASPGQTRPTIGWNLKDLDQFQCHHLVQAGTSLSVHMFFPHTLTTKVDRKAGPGTRLVLVSVTDGSQLCDW